MAKVAFRQPRSEQNNIKVTLRPVHAFGQALGILPDLQNKGAFRRILLVFYAVFVVLGMFYLMFFQVFLKGEPKKSKEASLTSYIGLVHIVYGLMAFNFVLFLRLTMSWPSLIDKWSSIDTEWFNNGLYEYPWNLKWISPAIILLNILIPVGQVSISHYMVYSKLSSIPANNGTVLFAQIAHAIFPQLSGLRPVLWPPVFVCVYLIALGYLTLATAFFESFVNVVSLNLASRLKQLSSFAKFMANSVDVSPKREHFWIIVRRDYTNLSNLTSSVDDQICLLNLCSYIRSLMLLLTMLTTFLALGLFQKCNAYLLFKINQNPSRKLTTPAEKLYCFYAGFHFLTKLSLLTLFSAWINEESTKILRVLNTVTSQEYGNEVRRFIMQIRCDDVALTGYKMFKLKKNLILKVINAVVTYELIIIQYFYNST